MVYVQEVPIFPESNYNCNHAHVLPSRESLCSCHLSLQHRCDSECLTLPLAFCSFLSLPVVMQYMKNLSQDIRIVRRVNVPVVFLEPENLIKMCPKFKFNSNFRVHGISLEQVCGLEKRGRLHRRPFMLNHVHRPNTAVRH